MDKLKYEILSTYNKHQISDVYNLNLNLKTGLPGRPRKIRIIVQKHIRYLSSLKKQKRKYTIPREYDHIQKNSISFVQYFYSLLGACDNIEKVYNIWPSVSEIQCKKKKNQDVYSKIHYELFK